MGAKHISIKSKTKLSNCQRGCDKKKKKSRFKSEETRGATYLLI